MREEGDMAFLPKTKSGLAAALVAKDYLRNSSLYKPIFSKGMGLNPGRER